MPGGAPADGARVGADGPAGTHAAIVPNTNSSTIDIEIIFFITNLPSILYFFYL